MKIRSTLAITVPALLAIGACFDSLVDEKCGSGYMLQRDVCVPRPAQGTSPDAAAATGTDCGASAVIDAAPPADAMVDAMPDALVCTAPQILCRNACLDGASDPDNCGACGKVCASGVCTSGTCTGTLSGHIVAIGHDYRASHAAMARVIGNAVALGSHTDVAVGRLHGTADPAAVSGTSTALSSSLAAIGRPFHSTDLPDAPAASTLTSIDVLVVDAQTGDGVAAQALGTTWKPQIDTFLGRGGVVVVLEGTGGVGYRFASGAALYTLTAAPIGATDELASVADGTDVTTQQVVSPYRAESTSVTLPGSQHPVITAASGGTLVFHLIR